MVAANNSEREEAEAEAVSPVATALSMASVASGAESPPNAASSQDTLDGRRARERPLPPPRGEIMINEIRSSSYLARTYVLAPP